MESQIRLYNKGGSQYEGKTISKTYVRKVQNNQKKRQDYGYLRKPQAQTKTGLINMPIAA